jgi:hypothetical protein
MLPVIFGYPFNSDISTPAISDSFTWRDEGGVTQLVIISGGGAVGINELPFLVGHGGAPLIRAAPAMSIDLPAA